MTIAAVILAASASRALADAAGVPRVRRIADAAWPGGAMPIIVVTPDPDGTVAIALAGASVTLVDPAPSDSGPVGQIVRGIEMAAAEISDVTGALVWPARFCWVGPETVTSLVEAHGMTPDVVIRPTYHEEAGWPALVPMTALAALRGLGTAAIPDDLLDELIETGITLRVIDLGDPGTVIDGDTERSALPPYEGPQEASGAHEWGSAAAATPEEAPLEAPPSVGSEAP
ncbi:MAG: NTP transferase domain-containing protein [Candidatus Limnocylindrales bacterium]